MKTLLLLSLLLTASAPIASTAGGDRETVVSVRDLADDVLKFHGSARRETNAHWVRAHDGVLDRQSGQLTFRGEVRTYEALSGFCASVRVEFLDDQGRIVWVTESPALGVDGTHVPFTGPSQRFVDVSDKMHPCAAAAAVTARVRVQHRPKDSGVLLRENIERIRNLFGK